MIKSVRSVSISNNRNHSYPVINDRIKIQIRVGTLLFTAHQTIGVIVLACWVLF